MGELTDLINTKQRRGIFVLPEEFENYLSMINFRERVKNLEEDPEIFEDELYYRCSEKVCDLGFQRDFIERTLVNVFDIIKFKDPARKFGTGKITPQAINPLSLAQLLSWATQKPIEKILKKENKYLDEVAEHLLKKVLNYPNKKIAINSEYTLKEIREKTKLTRKTLQTATNDTKILPFKRENMITYIKGKDLILYLIKNTKKLQYTKKEIQEMFGFPEIDIYRLGIPSADGKKYHAPKVHPVYDRIAAKVRNKILNPEPLEKITARKHTVKPVTTKKVKNNPTQKTYIQPTKKVEKVKKPKEQEKLEKITAKIKTKPVRKGKKITNSLIYAMDYYEDDLEEGKNVPPWEDIYINEKAYTLSGEAINSLLDLSPKFSENSKAQVWNKDFLDYVVDNLKKIFKAKPNENGLYTAYNTTTEQKWCVKSNQNLITKVKIYTKKELEGISGRKLKIEALAN